MLKYTLTMTEEQARITVAALDFWMRMRLGQWKELVGLCLPYEQNVEYCDRRDEAELRLMSVRDFVMPELPHNGSYSVYNFPETERAFNILKAVRSAIAWHNNPEGGWTVDFDRPMDIHVKEEMPKCVAMEEGEK